MQVFFNWEFFQGNWKNITHFSHWEWIRLSDLVRTPTDGSPRERWPCTNRPTNRDKTTRCSYNPFPIFTFNFTCTVCIITLFYLLLFLWSRWLTVLVSRPSSAASFSARFLKSLDLNERRALTKKCSPDASPSCTEPKLKLPFLNSNNSFVFDQNFTIFRFIKYLTT